MKPRPHRTHHGYSLVEVTAAAALFAVVTLAILGVYRMGLGTEAMTAQRTKLQDALRYGGKVFEREIGEASASFAISSSRSVTVLIPTYGAGGLPSGFVDTVSFTASGSAIYQTVVPGIVSNRVAFINKRLVENLPVPYPSPGLFTYWTRESGLLSQAEPASASIVRVTLVQTAAYGERRQTVQVSQDIRMRNRL